MTTYYTYDPNTRRITPAPRVITNADGSRTANPTAAQSAAIGAYPLADPMPPAPTPPEGKRVVPEGYETIDTADGKAWVRTYRYEDALPPLPRRWTRFSIKTALARAGMLVAAKEYLQSVEIEPDYLAWEALSDCDYIEEGYGGTEKWNAMLDGAAVALGKDRSEIDAFLDMLPQS